MADIKEPPKKGIIRGLLGGKAVPKSQKKEKEREGVGGDGDFIVF